MATFIYESMSTGARNYHHVQHVFDVIENNTFATQPGETVLDPIAILATLFHDCVYANVDGGLSDEQRAKLRGAIDDTTAETSHNQDVPVQLKTHPNATDDSLLRVALNIFGFEANEILQPNRGQNEFLSAVIALRELESLLPPKTLVMIAACIEATIPFRGSNDDNEDPLELLYERVCRVSEQFELNMSEDECLETVKRATLVGNEDVGGFGTSNHDHFMDITWSLLPETNEALRDTSYSVFDFHCAVYKMYSFFTHMQSNLVFHQFRGYPEASLVTQRTVAAEENIQFGKRYLAAKLIGTSFLASIAVLTGGDAPIQLFMGQNTTTGGPSMAERLHDSKQDIRKCDSTNCQVSRLLTEGRVSVTSFDLQQSPISTYLYNILGDKAVGSLADTIDTYPMTKAKARLFLARIPKDAVHFVANIMADLATERREKILQTLLDL